MRETWEILNLLSLNPNNQHAPDSTDDVTVRHGKMKKKKIPQYIINFCKEHFNEKPIFVPLISLPDVEMNNCFSIVEEHINENGGKQIFGWCIHVWRQVMIEVEFHSVWETPEGKLIDITPKRESGKEIVFIPDPEKTYNGQQMNNIRKQLTTDPDAKRFIELFDEHFRITNEGDLAKQHGLIKIGTGEYNSLAKEIITVESRLKRKYGNNRVLY